MQDTVLHDIISSMAIRGRESRLVSRRGASLSWLIDLRPVLLNNVALKRITSQFWMIFADREPFQIAGMETASIPLLIGLVMTAPEGREPLNATIIRKERKTTGSASLYEGQLNDLPIVLIDDILNSGDSAGKALAVLDTAGRTVRDLFVVIDYQSDKGLSWRQEHCVAVTSLFRLHEFGLEVHKRKPTLTQHYALEWCTDIEGGNPFYVVPKSSPTVVGDRIYRGSDAAKMHAFDAATGDIVWSFQATGAARKGIWSTPAVHDGLLYFGAYNGTMYCLEAASGREVWSRSYGEWIGASPLIVPKHGLLYIGIEYERPWAQGSLTALRLDNGEKVWERDVKKLQHGSAAYYAKGDLVVWGSADHETLGLDAVSGDISWRFSTQRSVKCAPAVDEDLSLAAFASFDKHIYVVDVRNGALHSNYRTEDLCYTTPLFKDGRLYCGSGDRHLYVIDLEQKNIAAKLNLKAKVYASPVAIGNRIVTAAEPKIGRNGVALRRPHSDAVHIGRKRCALSLARCAPIR